MFFKTLMSKYKINLVYYQGKKGLDHYNKKSVFLFQQRVNGGT